MKILVTGGAGYIGTELLRALDQNPVVDELVLYDNLSTGNSNFFLNGQREKLHKVQFVFGELLDSRKLRKCLDGVDIVYHLAARVTTPFANTDPHFYEQINHWGTAELVYAIEESDIKKFIYTSSASVYGSTKEILNEQSIPNPRTFYGISKLRGEEHVSRLFEKLDTYIIRCGNIYGYSRSMRFDAVINRFMFDANFKHRITINGKGTQHRAFIHIDPVVQALSGIIENEVPGGTYNLVDRNLQVLDIVDTLKELYPDLEYMFINQHLNLKQMKVDPESRLRQYIDFSNPRTLKEELKGYLEFFSF